nr:uncharacterized mitochondrial protein AtMg00810-like [Tanacetum cinerariifolium]
MTGNISYLTNYEEIDGGFVTFGGNSKGGKEFKLTDKSYVLLKVPRKDNMYNVDLKNVVPQGGLTCLFVKAKSDESTLWHRRIGHVNFKTINKLVKGNLVRGLPSKLFEINQTCVACQKGKQHRASYALTKSMSYKPVVAGNQSNGSVGTQACNNDGKAIVEIVHDKDYILLPLWTLDLLFSSSSKDSSGDGFKPSGDEEKKDVEDPGNKDNEVPSIEEPRINQEKDANVTSTNNINTVSPTDNAVGLEDNDVDENIVYGCANDPNMPDLEEISRFSDAEDDDTGADINNLDTYFQVSLVPTTRIPNDHPLNQVIDDVQSAIQTRNMSKNLEEHGKELCTEFEKIMHKKFKMSSMGELTFFLGLQVKQKEDEIFISQDKYVNKILNKFSFSDLKTASTPMEIKKPLLKDDDGVEVDVHLYRSMIGSLMYLTFSRPDIMFAVCTCVKFQVNPKILHLYAVKRIFRYLKGQPKLGLWYPKDSSFNLVAYTDSDYAGASLDRKSTTGGCQFLGCRLLSWQCKKQTVVANSTTAAEYIAASNCCGRYALTINHTIYNSCIEQFWATVNAKNINGEAQIHVKVDGKKVIIYEATIRRDLKFKDEGEFNCLSNEVIFEQLPLIGSTVASTIICLAINQKFKFSKYIFESMVKHLDIGYKFLMYPRKIKKKVTEVPQPCNPTENAADEAVNEEIEDSLVRAATTAASLDAEQDRETTKTYQAMEIDILKRRVKKLEKKQGSKTHKIKRLYKVSLSARIESSDEEQSLVADKEVNAVKEVDATQDQVSAATTTTAKDLTIGDITLAKELEALKTSKPKIRGIVVRDHEEPKPEMSLKKKDQISLDEELAFKLQAKKEEEERIARENALEANIVVIKQWHDVQAKIEADFELAQRLHQEEEEQFIDDKKAKLFMEFLKKRRKFFVAKRAEKRMNRPPTKAQQRSLITELVEESLKKAEESSSKRKGENLEQESSKKQKVDDDQEAAELKKCLEIVPDDRDDVTIDATQLYSMSPTIINYKIHKEGRKSYF